MRYLVGRGAYASITVDEEIDLGALPPKFAALRTQSAPTEFPAAEKARLAALFPVEQYDPEQHGPGPKINAR